MNEIETEGAAANATAAYTLMEVAQDAYTALEKLQGAAAAAAVPNNNVTQITHDALLICLKECEEQSHGVNHWIDYALESTSRNLPLMRRKAQTAARDFTALEHSLSQAYDLQETWETVNTISRKEMEDLPLNAAAYNLSPNRLATLITGWEKNLSNAKS